MTVIPVVNINGSHPPTLLSQYVLAVRALKQAMDAVQAIDCHGRDYQTIRNPANAGMIAREEHAERARRLSTIQYELELIASSIQRQIEARTPPQSAA